MVRLNISPEAEKDIIDIGDYIVKQLNNPQAALHVIGKIKKSVFGLKQFPEIGTPIGHAGSQVEYRYLVSGNYMTFYHYKDDTVYIDRILYGRSNYIVTLFGDVTEEDSEQYKCRGPNET